MLNAGMLDMTLFRTMDHSGRDPSEFFLIMRREHECFDAARGCSGNQEGTLRDPNIQFFTRNESY